MDVKNAIAARKSIRKYLSKPIPDDIMEELLDAMRLAPSSNNKQRWSMVVVTDNDTKKMLVPASGNQKFVGECSAYFVGVTEPDAFYSTVDMTIALDHLTLRATELGLGTCWIGDFDEGKIKEILGIPAERSVPICMTLGYPNHSPGARSRKKLSEIFHSDKWETRWE